MFIVLSINSCNYPDIDSIPDFKGLNITMQESIDLCNIKNTNKDKADVDCYKEIKDISDRL